MTYIIVLSFLVAATMFIYSVIKTNSLAQEYGIIIFFKLVKSSNPIIKKRLKKLLVIFCIGFVQFVVVGLIIILLSTGNGSE